MGSAIQLFFKENVGGGKSRADLSKLYSELGVEGQKKYIDQSTAATASYNDAMAAWSKTKDGKKFAQKGEAKKQRAKVAKAKQQHLEHPDAPQPPAKPKNARQMFDEAKRAELLKHEPNLGARELSSRIAKLWEGLSLEEKKPFESRAQAFKDAYQFEVEQYRETPQYKAYLHAISSGKRKSKGEGRESGAKRTKKKSDYDEFGMDSDDSDDLLGSDSDSVGL